MPHDRRGLAMTAANADAVAAFDHAVAGYLGLTRDAGQRLKAVLEADPDMVMAHVLKGYFFMLMATGPLTARAVKAATEAKERIDGADKREWAHVAAVDAWAHGQKRQAIAKWEEILVDHPRDVLALRLAHHGHFYEGDGQNLRDTVARCLHAWNEDVPDYGFVMGMRSFGLEETHTYEAAIEAGEMAVALNPEDPWAIHAVAHVHEMTDRPEDGIQWITEQEPGWTGCNNFRYHIYWHRALMRLDRGEYDLVLRLYDDELWDPDSDEYLDLVNDAALLLRLELHGVDVGDRWQALAAKCRDHATDHILAFIDVHYATALAAVDTAEADDMVDAMRAYAEGEDDNAETTRAIGLPLAEALVAHRQGDHKGVVARLAPIRYDLHRMGGSHAQRDLFAMVLLDSAIRAGRVPLARSLAAERLCRMPDNAWTNAAFDRAMAL